jgi:hypothetical protein
VSSPIIHNTGAQHCDVATLRAALGILSDEADSHARPGACALYPTLQAATSLDLIVATSLPPEGFRSDYRLNHNGHFRDTSAPYRVGLPKNSDKLPQPHSHAAV